jgi:hypothetical protein
MRCRDRAARHHARSPETWLERDLAILVDIRGADEYARERGGLRVCAFASRPPGVLLKRLVFPRNSGNCTQSHGQRFDNLIGQATLNRRTLAGSQ